MFPLLYSVPEITDVFLIHRYIGPVCGTFLYYKEKREDWVYYDSIPGILAARIIYFVVAGVLICIRRGYQLREGDRGLRTMENVWNNCEE